MLDLSFKKNNKKKLDLRIQVNLMPTNHISTECFIKRANEYLVIIYQLNVS